MRDKAMPYPLLLPGELRKRIRDTARCVSLSQADLMRQSMELGIPLLLERLAKRSGRVTNAQPLPKGVLARAYRLEEAGWQRVEAAAVRNAPLPALKNETL